MDNIPITHISWTDLEAVLSQSEVEQLADNDLKEIAWIMADLYVDQSFWDHLEFAARKIIGGTHNP